MMRDATINDDMLTFNWLNNSYIRKYSFNKSKVSFSDHYQWFEEKIYSRDTEYYILEINNIPIGSIRFDEILTNNAKINYLIDPLYSGKGYGKHILEHGIIKLKKSCPDVKNVYGVVFEQNIASIKIFNKLGFDNKEKSNSKILFKKNI